MWNDTQPPFGGTPGAAMRGMFAARKRVFIDLLKWDLPVLAGEFELDQFDDEHAEYLILTDDVGRHRASARLLRSEGPHILGDLYPYLCAGPVPTGPTIREITRFCLDPAFRAPDRRRARNELVTTLAEHGLRAGITDYTGVASQAWFEQIKRFGWQCRRLGEPVAIDGKTLVGLHIALNETTLDGLDRAGIRTQTSLNLVVTEDRHGAK
jgi:N-acyl-L-homoserine lactone synthetase